ncbi:MAG: riboflavin biosynthesis protein RibD [Candidatus Anoxymicrobium japonicum]|uniref:Riboflavin biosynthesis protein RibD n=1 Tax=Candidatus Anoxymicrobium japonicum TaxID=2013648 RepID=A0A2N3G663_9ACTN|nr:MAG: riboflavin biosynthesis protein RibD [Candidatus Anoxymicrobium japonicum]
MKLISCATETIAGLPKPTPCTVDETHMLRALELAEMGKGTTSPNPVVGAVIVADGVVVGEGYHERAGGPHAEARAISAAGERAHGATMYVTLEPCAHQGRTPPCSELITRVGISRLVAAMRDPNPLVSGKGELMLRDSGVDVVQGPYSSLAKRQNEFYVKWITTGWPFVTLKMAMSVDGKVSTRNGESKWVTSKISRADAHRMRSESDAVMVGIGTVLCDDPALTARQAGLTRQPRRVIVDSMARTPLDSNVADVNVAKTIVAVSQPAPAERLVKLDENGVEVIQTGSKGTVDLSLLLEELGKREIVGVLCEGGPTLAASLWEEGLVDKLIFYIAPKIIGGAEAAGPIGGKGVASMALAGAVEIDTVCALESDIRVVAYPRKRPGDIYRVAVDGKVDGA